MAVIVAMWCLWFAGGTLYYRKSGRTQKVVTDKVERDSILDDAHIGGSAEDQTNSVSHADNAAMLAIIETQYKWPDIQRDIDDWVHACSVWCLLVLSDFISYVQVLDFYKVNLLSLLAGFLKGRETRVLCYCFLCVSVCSIF